MTGHTQWPFGSMEACNEFLDGLTIWANEQAEQNNTQKYSRVQTLYIPGKLIGFNTYDNLSRYTFYAANKEKQSTQESIACDIRKAKLEPCKSKVDIDFIWKEANRKRDPDNVASNKKFILDALVNSKILKNDGHRFVGNFTDTFHIGSTYGVTVILKERAVEER